MARSDSKLFCKDTFLPVFFKIGQIIATKCSDTFIIRYKSVTAGFSTSYVTAVESVSFQFLNIQ